MNISQALNIAKDQLTYSKTPALDAEVLLAFLLHVSRSYLFAWPEKLLSSAEEARYVELIREASQGKPIAYITGHQEFWSLDLLVTSDVLIPRPETELLVEKTLSLYPSNAEIKVADLGTGSGAIALALANERKNWKIVATDQSGAALAVAKKNASRLAIHTICWSQGNWCEALPSEQFDIIVSNPPYIDIQDPCLKCNGLPYEPQLALVSSNKGLSDIETIIVQSKNYLKICGYILLEHGYNQARLVRELLSKFGYRDIVSYRDLAKLERVTIAKKS